MEADLAAFQRLDRLAAAEDPGQDRAQADDAGQDHDQHGGLPAAPHRPIHQQHAAYGGAEAACRQERGLYTISSWVA